MNQHDLLLGLTGIPDRRLVLWNWREERLICKVSTELNSSECRLSFAGDASNSANASKTILVSAKGERSVWKVKRCGDERRLRREAIIGELNVAPGFDGR